MELKIEVLPLAEIKPYENNAKLHPDEQIEQIMKSIELVGFNDPIAIWSNGEIIEGHGRYEAAKRLGFDTIPVIRLDDLTDEQRKAYALIHNKLTMNSGFDLNTMSEELKKIKEFDMTAFDFDMGDVFTPLTSEALDSLFADAPEKEKKAKTIRCPHCGEEFEV